MSSAVVLTDRYASTVARLASQNRRILLSLWDSFDTHTMDDADLFHAKAKPVVRGSAHAAVSASSGYAAGLGVRPASPSPLIAADAAARIYDPFDAIGARLLAGDSLADAVAFGRAAMDALASNTAFSSSRQAIGEAMPERTKWVRRVSGKSCDWCMSLSGVVFDFGPQASFGHDHCDCTAVPESYGAAHNDKVRSERGWDANAKNAWDNRKQIRSLRDAQATAERRQAEAKAAQVTEPDRKRRERLSVREQEWETRAERAAERLRLLDA